MTDMVKHGQNSASGRTVLSLLVAGILISGAALGSTTAPLPAAGDPAPQAATGAKAAPAAAPAKAPAAKKKTVAKKSPAKKAAVAPQPAKKAPPEKELAGRRDPFRIPPPPTPGQGVTEQVLGPLPPGTRGLLINQLRLEGIVRLDTTNTMIAVVDNNTNRAYFLRENDAVYDGVVSKITPDSVLFKQNFVDPAGHSGVSDVVKRLGPGPGEGR